MSSRFILRLLLLLPSTLVPSCDPGSPVTPLPPEATVESIAADVSEQIAQPRSAARIERRHPGARDEAALAPSSSAAPPRWLAALGSDQRATVSSERGAAEAYVQIDADGVSQIHFIHESGDATAALPVQLTYGPEAKRAPAIVYLPIDRSFLVVFSVERAPGQNEINVVTVAADASGGARVSRPIALAAAPPNDAEASDEADAMGPLSFNAPAGVWVAPREEVFVVFHTDTALYAAWVKPRTDHASLVSPVFKLMDDRAARVSSPSVAYAPESNRLMLAWGLMRSQENVELGVMSPDDAKLTIPARETWTHEQSECNFTMAPACIEGGDRPALAYNAAVRRFGLAIADDLNDGSRLEGFVIQDTCSATACDVQMVGRDNDTSGEINEKREQTLATMGRITGVGIAADGADFLVGFAFADAESWDTRRLGMLSFGGLGTPPRSPPRIVGANPVR